MKQYKKYRILGVVALILAVVSIGLLVPAYANPEQGQTEEQLTCQDLAERYGLYIVAGDADNTYKLFREGSYAEACGNKEGNDLDLQIIKVNNVDVPNGAILSKAGDSATVTAQLIKSGESEYMTVTLKNLEPPEGIEEEIITVKYEIQVLAGGDRPETYETNNLYNDASTCVALRNEVAGMDASAKAFFQDDLSYCWKTSVPAGTNYTKAELETKIARSKATWSAYTAERVTVSPSFQQEFNRIKANAERVGNTYNSESQAAQRKTLKCNYQYLPIAGKTYTNAYGETINKDGDVISPNNVSDGSTSYAYMNKDYYYATDVKKFGSVEYVYNYAPGKDPGRETKTNVCTRTCRESVKVEYGAPIASKAGLCFSYQVKVTSYVLCESEFDAPKPKKPGSCNPGVRCVSPSGTVRGKPQAGPTEDFEQCISKCDGGKYTQKCSVKCYNEVYAKESDEKEIKLALTPGSAVATPLASRSNYSLSDCKAEHSDGCYYYSGGSIHWSSNASYNKCERSSLGRYYNDIGYGTLCHWSGGRQYIADGDGFVRGDYGGALCDDHCEWTSGGCSGKYLNPNTSGRDYNANMESYDKARLACLAAATCTSKTANVTISIKYDADVEKNNTMVEETITVDFPIGLNTDKVTSRGEGATVEDTFEDKRSTLLARAGCYLADKSNELDYMVEWSFPGTYIHNKTGEITFKFQEEDTSGWYFEDNKFCMPLNAKSVNTKWWEWYKVAGTDFGKTCYTKSEIEAELNSTNKANGYNINAVANNYGHFGWNFDINCFYAIRNEICNVDETNAAGKKCCKPDTPNDTSCGTNGASCYIVRTIDREDMFPNAPIAGMETQKTRKIGFNWTDAAKITGVKNPDYQVNPVELIEHIQNNANEIYNNDNVYLDYQFYLTPETLRKIKKYNDKYAYDEWNGKMVEKNGIYVYLSNLWNGAEGSIESNINLRNISGAVLKTGDPGVNNE